ncbi:hypothetical protein R1sor_021716 [Riccia sorocarpa]|uniref:Uncharacterized protein n=1 Tax=Riccia sorocarpa TaxID=122646 RepID=A0ABD3GL50_9MARC
MLTPNPKSLSTVGDNTQMTQAMSCIRFSLPTDDTSRRRRLSVEILYSSGPDRDEISSGASEGRSNDELCAGSENEGEFENCACELKRPGIVPNTTALTIAEEGFEVQTPFIPGRIQVNARTGMITILPADEQHDVLKANVIIPRNIQNVTAAIAGRSSTTARKLLPGRLVSLRHSVELRFLRVDHSNGSIRSDRSIARADEVFAVVSLPIHEDAFALKCVGTNKYLKCEAEGKLVHAVCDALKVGPGECFMEEDAGGNLIAVRSVRYNQFWGSGHPLKLYSKIEPHGKFEVVPAVHVF